MTAQVLTSAFLDELEKLTLLSPAQLNEVRNLSNEVGTDAKHLATELIRRDWLTPFQVNQLLQGRGASLKLGPYVLLERVGKGGMGEVFKARHALMDRLVALKVLRADRLDDPDYLSRFRREMQAAAKLTHPNVVLAHDAALVGDVYFLAMEYIEGIDLSRLLVKCKRLPVAQACDCIRQAALGLQHAHERGLVHRDIKPSNLILATPGNTVKLLDLGLARLRSCLDLEATTSGLTREGTVMGTPDYIAPEQAVDPRTADIRADIYSLGCTLYHLLTGRPPFPGGTLTQKLLKHQQEEPDRIEAIAPEVPIGLARVVRKMMAKRPQDRYQLPQAVADALNPFADTAAEPLAEPILDISSSEEAITTIRSADSTQTVPLPKPKRLLASGRNRVLLLVALAAGLFLVLALLIGIPLLLLSYLPVSSPLPEPGTTLSAELESKLPDAPNVKPEVLPVGQPREAAKLPEIKADGPARLIADLKGHTGTIQCLGFSSDGKQLASGGDDNQARLWDGLTGKPHGSPLRQSDPVRALAFSPDGQRLAAASYGGGYDASIKLWNLAAPRDPRTLPWKITGTPSLAEVHGLAFSPDGKRLASGGGPLRLWDLEKGGEPTVLQWQKTFPSYLYGMAFSPDGKWVAAGCHGDGGDNVRVWQVDSKDEPILVQGNKQAFGLSHSDVRGVVAYAAGEKFLVRVTSNGRLGFQEPTATVMIWDVDPVKELITLRDTIEIPGGAVFALTSAADGRLRVAVAAGNPGLLNRPGVKPSPGVVKLWDGRTGKVRTFETGHKQNIMALAFSPDGTRLATGSADQTAKLWDLGPPKQ